jgi:hypothetical protein
MEHLDLNHAMEYLGGRGTEGEGRRGREKEMGKCPIFS